MLATGIALLAVFVLVAYLRRSGAAPGIQGLLVAIAGLLTALLIFQIFVYFVGD